VQPVIGRLSLKLQNGSTWDFRTLFGQREYVRRCSIVTSQQIQDGGRPPFCRSLSQHMSVKNRPILMKLGTLQHILNQMTVTSPKNEIFKIQDGGRLPSSKSSFRHTSAIHRPISADFCNRKHNSIPKKSCDINCKFRESKMADGRYFEIVNVPHINQ